MKWRNWKEPIGLVHVPDKEVDEWAQEAIADLFLSPRDEVHYTISGDTLLMSVWHTGSPRPEFWDCKISRVVRPEAGEVLEALVKNPKKLADALTAVLPKEPAKPKAPVVKPKPPTFVAREYDIYAANPDDFDFYTVRIDWHLTTVPGEKQDTCTCPAFKFGKGKPCKHIKAVLDGTRVHKLGANRLIFSDGKVVTLHTEILLPLRKTSYNYWGKRI